jgi:3-deoxy-D-manno-octulosonate 8-phosphate phosphatase KdsC-like HAD superfamily phosphatase
MASIPLLSQSPAALETLSRVEILYTDLDGTLLGFGGSLLLDGAGKPSTATAEAIVRLNAAGLTVVITTGRNRIQSGELSRVLGWGGSIAELGCIVIPNRGVNPIYLTGDWPADLLGHGDTPFSVIERAGAVSALMEAFPGRLEPHAPYHLNREATVLLRGLVDTREACAVLAQLPVPIELVDNGIVHPLKTGLIDLPEIHAYHLMPPGVAKHDAVTLDLARREVSLAHAAAIGDSATDVAMGTATALAVLVSNALDDERVLGEADGRDNVYAVSGKRGDGWVEFADAWLAARSAR